MKRRIVITGVGSITPVGITAQDTWQGMLHGKGGIDRISLFDTTEYATRIAGQVYGYDATTYFDSKEVKKLDRYTQFAIIAADEAIRDAQLDLEHQDMYRVGVIVGSGIGGIQSFEDEHQKIMERGPKRVSPYFIPQMISDIAAGMISIKYGFKGPNYATVSACATSAHAIGSAMRTIQYGDADVVICGGSEAAITPIGVAGFNAMKALSTFNEDPHKASRPFDLNRDGFVMGEGAGILVLEDLDHALNRDAKIYAEITGVGFTADAYHITQPAPGGEGAVRAMLGALKDAGLNTGDVQYINAHGTSTPFNDKNETAAIKALFGEHSARLKVSSTKSMTGHMLGAAGSVEAIVCAFVVQHDKIPPTINYETPDPECDLDYVPNQAVSHEVNVALSNSFGFGGHNASLCIQKYR
jgi:3-oxoacyl-[acyl-carrier-protein] synthase II